VRRELTSQVLPAVTDPSAHRQLRAALHVLDVLERSWDLLPAYLAADNADIRGTLLCALTLIPDPATTGFGELAARLNSSEQPEPVAFPGTTDPTLRELMADNAFLQQSLEDLIVLRRLEPAVDDGPQAVMSEDLLGLQRRMVTRAAAAAGLDND
jgi:hypothetical protein